jgi:hypothetical protein
MLMLLLLPLRLNSTTSQLLSLTSAPLALTPTTHTSTPFVEEIAAKHKVLK